MHFYECLSSHKCAFRQANDNIVGFLGEDVYSMMHLLLELSDRDSASLCYSVPLVQS